MQRALFFLSVDSKLLPDASISSNSCSPGDFIEISTVEKRTKKQTPQVAPEVAKETDIKTSSLFACPSEGCVKSFQRYYNLEQHLLYGKCKKVQERYNLADMAKLSYTDT